MVHKKKKKVTQPLEVPVETKTETADEGGYTREKRARLIVRNLPFANLSEDSVRKCFEEFGKVIDVNLLKKSDGKYVGCGFVEYDHRQSAAKAIAKANGKQISGRSIVVDWALPKNTFIDKVQQYNNIKKEEPDDECDSKSDLKFNTVNIDDNPEDEDEDEDEEDDDDDDDDNEDNNSQVVGEPKKRQLSNDVDEGKTVFLKNVPFSATNEDVKKCAQQFGDVFYALICIDKLTEHSKGSAFVKFKEKSSADACLKSQLSINDQHVEVTPALSKTQLEDHNKQKKLKTKDSRNLYLVREGVVMAGSPAAITVSPADMAKRLQIEQWKTQILRNLNMFISKTRIVIHNLPASYDDARLREMVAKHVPKSAVIREAKVMQDRKKFDSQGNAQSKEMAFVSLGTHEDTLSLLRKINNNPQVFTASRRPIVSFSIENRQILNLKQKRLEKSRAKLPVDSKNKTLEKLNRKQRRFQRRKENIIKKRQESKKGLKPDTPGKSKKPDKSNQEKLIKQKAPTNKRKREETEPSIDNDEYSGVQSVPGKKLKMRSILKLKKQAEIHKQRLKEVKKIKKNQKTAKDKKVMHRQREPAVKKGKKKFESDEKFTKLINSYKQKIEQSGFKKWYEN